MGIVFLIIFTLAEIALVVLTFTKFREKAKWMRNRAAIRAAETVLLLGIVLVPAVHMKWRFFLALGVLVIRLLIAGIVWLARRKKAEGLRKKPRTVVSCVLSVILLALALVPSFLFTNYNGLPVTGQYGMKEVSAILVDRDREDPFENDGSSREVPAHFYYPENAAGSYPLVIFSHGAFGYYQSNFSTYAELVSNGYVVVALDHPHHSFFTKDTGGRLITVDQKFIEDVVGVNEEASNEFIYSVSKEWLKLRVDDENFVLDTIKAAKESRSLNDAWHTEEEAQLLDVLSHTDTGKIGLMGHSLGGASAVALGRERKDIGAAIDIDGTMLGEITDVRDGKCTYNTEPYPVPVLALFTENNYNMIESDESGYYRVNENMINNAKDGRIVTFENAEHMDFTDLPLFSPFLGSMMGSGDIDHAEALNTVNGLVRSWFDYYLKNEGTLAIQAKY